MKKILLVAQREFVTTVGTRGFLVGLFIMPALIGVFVLAGPSLLRAMQSPQVRGHVTVIDPTGQVLPLLRSALSPSGIEARRAENARRATAALGAQGAAAGGAMQQAMGAVPGLTIRERPADADLVVEKEWLHTAGPSESRLALVVVHPDAVDARPDARDFGAFDLYASRALDDATESTLFESMREAIVAARINAADLDRDRIEAMTRLARPTAVIVSAAGEQTARRQFTQFLPFMFGILLFVGVMMGGQTLMTSTIEEKSSRVVEVLLAAISPFQLLAGKLLGQLGVGLLALAIYIGLGLMALYSFAMFGLLHPMLLVYFFVFFLITYVVFAALMMAIGAAVNQMAEAQSLMGPVMILLLVPYLFSFAIGRAPNSTLSVVMSFLPPFNTSVMMSRLASETPPPAWQAWLTAAIGIGAAVGAIWFAAKVFKIGLLMHGKPPNFATLIRWARQA